ncbi:hypothetical protein QYE76_062715 [Lolium multiflorum]|uniref:CCHC-type domain-containing protein n=1 Tax=Lolium multiflorum TaxID=4521 RepID=A0AAD8S5Q7_LOLMU|nr:hypothetical protein QYE76_062715 [Lolium multiflorum]
MLKCPIHELPGNIIIDNFYARLSFQDKTLLDTACSGSFTRNKEEFKWDLLDRIQENTEGWENDKGRVSGINYNYECIETFMDTDEYRNISATYGLDSQVVANIYKAFASHFELPRKNFDKYHEPYKDKTDSPKGKCIEIKTVDHVLPEAYIEKTPFPAKMKEYSVITSVVNKSAKKPIEPEEQIKVEPAVAIVKDLVTENVEDGHIIFCEDASNIVSHPNKSRKASVPVLSVRIGDHCYYGLCDIGASISAIPYELYTEIMHEIGSCELEDIDVVIRLANRETISPIGIVRDVEVLCGKIKYPADFLVLGSAASKSCPIIFGRPFLNTCGAIIDCKKEKIVTKFAGESYEFNFSKFAKTPYKADLPNDDFRVEQCASIALAPNNPLQQHLENSESEVFREERDELDEIFLRQPILKHDLPVEDLGVTPPPKEDPVFDLKPLPDNLKYAYIDDKKTYPVIISAKLSDIEEERLLEILKKHRGAIGYTLDDLKGISPAICQHAINIEDGAKPVVEHQRRLIPKMKDVVRNEVLKLLEAEEIKELEAQVLSLKKDLEKRHEGKSTLDKMLSVQQSPNDKSGLGFNSNNKNKSKSKNNKKKGQDKVNDSAKLVCFKCKIEGHHVRSCPLKKKKHLSEKQQGKRPQGQGQAHARPQVEDRPLPKKNQDIVPQEKKSIKKRKGNTCYLCRVKGHFASSCLNGTLSNPIIVDNDYSLGKDKDGNVFAKFVGTQSGLKKRTIWVAKPIVTNLLGPNLVGDQQAQT